MADEVVVDCATGTVTVQPDTFLADRPAPVDLVPAVPSAADIVAAVVGAPDCPPGVQAALQAVMAPAPA